jgi:glycosyltransferase involved in cell wall biosynthesis
MAKKPFFSIIIPTLNEEKYLPNLLNDLQEQTLHDFEVIVVDGHSNDKTVSQAKKFTNKLPSLRIINSDTRQVCTQRNLGAKAAKANTLIFMDADNRLSSHFLSDIKSLWKESGADILTTRFQPDKLTKLNLAFSSAFNLFFELQNSLKPTYIVEAMIIISKQCFSAIGGFDETSNYAEGKSLIQPAIKLGYTSIYGRDPIWTYSFRRMRKYGLMGHTSRTIWAELQSILGLEKNEAKLYPMLGGSFYKESGHKALLTRLHSQLKSTSAQNIFITKLTTLFNSLKST